MSVELLSLDVKVTGEAGVNNRAVDAFALSYAVADIPKAVVSLHEVNDSGDGTTEFRRVFVGKEAVKLQQFQQKSFAGQASSATITVQPMGHSFTGNIVGPNLNILSNHYDNGVTFVHPLEVINSYTPHIYALSNDVNRGEDELLNTPRTNVFAILKALMEKRHKDFELLFASSKQTYTDAASRQNIVQLHERNKTVWPSISKILDASISLGGPTYTAFSEMGQQELYLINGYILNALKSTVFSMTEPFFFSLISIGDMFQSFYVPPLKGESEFGYFRSNREKVEGGIQKKLDITRLLATCNKLDNLPLQQVIVSGPAPKLNRATTKTGNNRYEFLGDNPTYAMYPKNPPKINGNNMSVALPAWIPAQTAPTSVKVKDNSRRDLDLNVNQQTAENLTDLVQIEVLTPIGKVIEELAETIYKNVALASYTVSITCLLDFDLLPGRRYTIIDEDGATLFSGFLQGAQHSASGISSSPSASTSLSFYAVTFGDFKLPE
jgi:hypothetical protein